MKTISAKRTVIVGIFIFVGLAIFATAVLVLGGQRKSFIQSVEVKTMFRDVGGLSKGCNVWYSGVKVGTVTSIIFTGHDQIEVRMNIEKSSRPYIHSDARARVSTDGLVGNKIIALSGGSAEAPSIKDGDVLLSASSISSDELMNTLQVNNKNLVDITNNLKTITENMAKGQGTLGKLVNDSTIYNNLDATLATLRKTSANTQRLTAGLADYAAGLQKKGVLAHDLISDTVIFNRLRSSSDRIAQLSENADEMMQNLKAVSASVNQQLNSSQSAAGVLLHDEETARDLKQTIINLESSTGRLNENMEALKHNFLFRGYFRRQEKAARKEREKQEKAAKEQQQKQQP